jgi:3-deoxy-manno-octulosonate cytidylyltransferase (CMP-KDO synthetase)
MKKVVAIIPARWGSTRFPGKPLHHIAGKPLLQHVWEAVRKARRVDEVIIATDDMRVAEAAFQWGAEVSLTSLKHRSGTDRIAEVARKLPYAAYLINVQGDEPLIEPHLIDRFVNELHQNPKCEMVTAAHPFDNPADANSPHQVKVVTDLAGNALYFSRASIPYPGSGGLQAAELNKRRPGGRRFLVLRHQGIYGFRRDTLLQFVRWKPSPLEQAEQLEQLRALENGVTVHVLVTRHGSPGVDTPQDAKTVAALLLKASAWPAGRRLHKRGLAR